MVAGQKSPSQSDRAWLQQRVAGRELAKVVGEGAARPPEHPGRVVAARERVEEERDLVAVQAAAHNMRAVLVQHRQAHEEQEGVAVAQLLGRRQALHRFRQAAPRFPRHLRASWQVLRRATLQQHPL